MNLCAISIIRSMVYAALLIAGILRPGSLSAHGDHASQPLGIIDPLVTHHAVLEDELKLNLFGSRLEREDYSDLTSSIELAYAFTDLLGAELFIPFGMTRQGDFEKIGFGDLELQLPKFSFIRQYGFVMTAYPAFVFPTGSTEAGLGGEDWVFAPHLLTDLAFGSMGLQMNGAVELASEGEVALEMRVASSYTLVLSPDRKTVLSPLLELLGEFPIRGEEEYSLTALPGLKLGIDGWHVGLGVQLPISGGRPFDFQALVQAGYHISWSRLAKTSPTSGNPK